VKVLFFLPSVANVVALMTTSDDDSREETNRMKDERVERMITSLLLLSASDKRCPSFIIISIPENVYLHILTSKNHLAFASDIVRCLRNPLLKADIMCKHI
jgi:hypothetical protein